MPAWRTMTGGPTTPTSLDPRMPSDHPPSRQSTVLPRVLVVEDNRSVAANVGEFLAARGWRVDHAYDGAAALLLLSREACDIIVLDLALPSLDGLEVCARLRGELGLATPVLMLTARDTLPDKLEGFEAGADDYLTKPFALAELDVRLHALLKREHGRSQLLCVADLVYDTRSLQVTRAGRPLRLSPLCLRMLEFLMRKSPAVVSRSNLIYHLWGDEPPDGDAALRVHVHALRAVIDKPFDRGLLHTIAGIGYALNADEH